jgi:hypothetical protein
MDTRQTNNPQEHLELAKNAYTAGEIDVDELEERIAHAFKGRAVMAPDVPLFDCPARPEVDKLRKVRR